jgi:hypothetical protein
MENPYRFCTNRVKAFGRQLRPGPESGATIRPAAAYSGLPVGRCGARGPFIHGFAASL